MKLPSWSTLGALAGGCGIGIGIMALLINKQRDLLANQASFYKHAIDIMKEQQTIKDLVGDEIQVGRATLNDGWSKAQRSHVQLRVPFKGDRDSAYLYAYARKKDDEDKLKLYKLEATFNKIAGKKLVMMDKTNEQEDDNSDDVAHDRASSKESKPKDHEDKEKPKRAKTKEELKEEMKNWKFR